MLAEAYLRARDVSVQVFFLNVTNIANASHAHRHEFATSLPR